MAHRPRSQRPAALARRAVDQATADHSRTAMVNTSMVMLLLALIVLLAGCGNREADEPEPVTEPDAVVDDGMSAQEMQGGQGRADTETIIVAGREAAELPPPLSAPPAPNTERYEDVEPNPVKVTAEDPVSTFSVDVDTASYSVVRRYLNDGVLPPRDAVRIEEMVNYFPYDYPLPVDEAAPFRSHIEVTPTPWNADTQLMRIGIKGYDIPVSETPALNMVLLIDVSGSMESPDKLPLLKQGMAMLVDTLDADDLVAIVVYAGASGVVLEPTPGDNRTAILGALDALRAGGSTAGGEGIRLAYSLAERFFDPDKVNRVVLATDGDFNVGITNPERLEDFVARKRDTGIYLTVLGFGRGNYNDLLMQRLAQAGNGQAAYIDTLREARKVLVDDVRATLFPIAKDVKIQVEFNPAAIVEYRLVGYETRLLNREDFANDAVDAGEIGSGHTVTAFYEVVPMGSPARLTEPLRYSEDAQPAPDATASEMAFVRIRYKLPDEDNSRLIEQPVLIAEALTRFEDASEDTRFAASVAAFGQYLRGDPYLRSLDVEGLLDIAINAKGEDAYGYRAEFTQLVRLAQSARAMEPLGAPPAP